MGKSPPSSPKGITLPICSRFSLPNLEKIEFQRTRAPIFLDRLNAVANSNYCLLLPPQNFPLTRDAAAVVFNSNPLIIFIAETPDANFSVGVRQLWVQKENTSNAEVWSRMRYAANWKENSSFTSFVRNLKYYYNRKDTDRNHPIDSYELVRISRPPQKKTSKQRTASDAVQDDPDDNQSDNPSMAEPESSDSSASFISVSETEESGTDVDSSLISSISDVIPEYSRLRESSMINHSPYPVDSSDYTDSVSLQSFTKTHGYPGLDFNAASWS